LSLRSFVLVFSMPDRMLALLTFGHTSKHGPNAASMDHIYRSRNAKPHSGCALGSIFGVMSEKETNTHFSVVRYTYEDS
jgi:hypothetical protein